MTPSTRIFCPTCNGPIPPDAPEALCPACAGRGGLELLESNRDLGFSDSAEEVAQELQSSLPEYDVLDSVGSGGAGLVFKARHRRLGRLVALKVLRPDVSEDPQFHQRFEREARALARLDHPNIVRVYDFGQAASFFFLALEYIEGANLRQLVATGLRPDQVLALSSQLCDALQYAHDMGTVHRDIKPENILVDVDGRVKITDFGLAKVVRDETSFAPLTQQGQVMGTPHYMAPEQVGSPNEVDHRADLYSLGVVLYELLTGQLPRGTYESPSRVAKVARGIDDVVRRSLQTDPQQRYQSAAEVKSALEGAAGHPPPVPASAPASSVGPRSRGRSLSVLCLVPAVVAIVLWQIDVHRYRPMPALCAAAGLGDTAEMTRILDHWWDVRVPWQSVDIRTVDGETALSRAAAAGHIEALEFLLERGADVDAVDYTGETALMRASASDLNSVVVALLGHGASNLLDHRGWSAADHAVHAGADLPLGRLGEAGFIGSSLENRRDGPLHRAIERSDSACVTAILSADFDVDSQDSRGRTALHLVIESGSAVVLPAVLNAHPYLEPRNNAGDTPLAQAAGQGSVELITQLLEVGADPLLLDRRKRTALEIACQSGHVESADVLAAAVRERDGAHSSLDSHAFLTAYHAGFEGRWKDCCAAFLLLEQAGCAEPPFRQMEYVGWTYKFDNLALAGLGSFAHLMAGQPDKARDWLQPISESATFGGDLFRMENRTNELEIEVFIDRSEPVEGPDDLEVRTVGRRGMPRDANRTSTPFQ